MDRSRKGQRCGGKRSNDYNILIIYNIYRYYENEGYTPPILNALFHGFYFLALALNAGPVPASPPPVLSAAAALPAQEVAATEIAALIAQEFAAWNARDLDAYMAVFWHSPQLLYIVQESVWLGWDEVRAKVAREYPNGINMGHPVLDRLQTNVLSAEMATTVEWWTVYFAAARVRGFTSSTWRRLPEGWRIVEGHTSAVETP
jgi:uncharacterized protein (TIGR02246 family)